MGANLPVTKEMRARLIADAGLGLSSTTAIREAVFAVAKAQLDEFEIQVKGGGHYAGSQGFHAGDDITGD